RGLAHGSKYSARPSAAAQSASSNAATGGSRYGTGRDVGPVHDVSTRDREVTQTGDSKKLPLAGRRADSDGRAAAQRAPARRNREAVQGRKAQARLRGSRGNTSRARRPTPPAASSRTRSPLWRRMISLTTARPSPQPSPAVPGRR